MIGFAIMILGTYANLGAIDEQQSGAKIQINRLPDIHITQPNENILNTPSKMEKSQKSIAIGPQKPIETVYESSANLKGPRLRKIKATKLPVQIEAIKEINLVQGEKEEVPVRKFEAKELILPEINFQPSSKSGAALKSKSIKNQVIEATTIKKSSESGINDEAIQREDREMEIDRKEIQQKDAKLTKEILDQVKNQLSKQNEVNQKLVLDKINEISEKVNNIAQMKNHSASQQKEAPSKNEVQNVLFTNVSNETKHLNDEKLNKASLPIVPVAKLLSNRQRSSAAPSQQILIEESKRKQTKSAVRSEAKAPIFVAKKIVSKKSESQKSVQL